MNEKLKLYGFNNLTKSLSFNIYDVCYAKGQREQKDYIAYIDEQYNSKRLTDNSKCCNTCFWMILRISMNSNMTFIQMPQNYSIINSNFIS